MANYTCIAENIAGRRESDVAVLSVYGMFNILVPRTEKLTMVLTSEQWNFIE